MAKSRKDAAQEAVRRTSQIADAREAARDAGRPAGPAEPFSGGLRREVLPLLVLHYIQGEPSYGNQLMERIAQVTAGVLSVNPNTMYPLLRTLESRGLIEGKWEHPERRSRRYYSITDAGREEYERMRVEVRPFLDSLSRSIEEIVAEVFH
jgi:PadR family transcriptional regulator PadR